MKFSISISLVLSSLFLFANSQTSYPECVNSSCGPFQSTALAQCGYDISSTSDATVAQTQCICAMSNYQAVFQPCAECLDLSPDPSVAASFRSTCDDSSSSSSSSSGSASSSPTSSSSSSSRPSSARTTSTTTSTSSESSSTSSDSTRSITTTTATTTTSSASSSSSNPSSLRLHIPNPSSTGAAQTMVPAIGLAMALLVAQAGL